MKERKRREKRKERREEKSECLRVEKMGREEEETAWKRGKKEERGRKGKDETG